MREVAEGVFEVRCGHVHAHLVVTDAGVVLVDTGLPGSGARKVGLALRDARRSIGDVTTILLTHRHTDHVGGLAELRRRSGATVVAHAIDVPFITGQRPAQNPPLLRLLSKVMKTAEPAPVDEALTTDGPFSVPGFTAIHTPGHTLGHVSFLLDRAGGVLFAGDAAGGGPRGRVSGSPGPVTDDRAAAKASVKRLAALEFTVAVFGHGAAVTDGAVERFRTLAAR
jgi:glyoxylase-like metal-dependent hydrolase (beta-lactamase superfamily II)